MGSTYKAVARHFMVALCKFADLCLSSTPSRFMYLQQKSTGSLQPGALFIKWNVSPRLLRSKSAESDKEDACKPYKIYANTIAYASTNEVNVAVVEIKKDVKRVSEAQHNERWLAMEKEAECNVGD